MQSLSHNLRKAAVLIRSLDAETAAGLLAQLSPEEADQLRAAIRALGPLDPEEQDDVAAEFRRAAPLVSELPAQGVELAISEAATAAPVPTQDQFQSAAKRFDFLDDASIESLGQFLVREHAQTIAIVLSYLVPERAAGVLAALPPMQQAETLERLSSLGDTDPECLNVVERELSAWVAKRRSVRTGSQRGSAVMSILAAAKPASRDQILVSLKAHKADLAKQLMPLLPTLRTDEARVSKPAALRNTQAAGLGARDWGLGTEVKVPAHGTIRDKKSQVSQPPAPSPQCSAPTFGFDNLIHLPASELAAIVCMVDASVLVLALVGSSDELVDRICEPMPRRMAKAFRRQLNKLGPTRLRDVEVAQQMVAAAAGRRLAERRTGLAISRA